MNLLKKIKFILKDNNKKMKDILRILYAGKNVERPFEEKLDMLITDIDSEMVVYGKNWKIEIEKNSNVYSINYKENVCKKYPMLNYEVVVIKDK